MTYPTDRFVYLITDEVCYSLYTLSEQPMGESPSIQLTSAEYADYLNVRTRWNYWQTRLHKAARDALYRPLPAEVESQP